MSGVKTQGHAVLGQYKVGAFMLTPPLRARLANEPRLSDGVRRPRKPRRTVKHVVTQQQQASKSWVTMTPWEKVQAGAGQRSIHLDW